MVSINKPWNAVYFNVIRTIGKVLGSVQRGILFQIYNQFLLILFHEAAFRYYFRSFQKMSYLPLKSSHYFSNNLAVFGIENPTSLLNA